MTVYLFLNDSWLYALFKKISNLCFDRTSNMAAIESGRPLLTWYIIVTRYQAPAVFLTKVKNDLSEAWPNLKMNSQNSTCLLRYYRVCFSPQFFATNLTNLYRGIISWRVRIITFNTYLANRNKLPMPQYQKTIPRYYDSIHPYRDGGLQSVHFSIQYHLTTSRNSYNGCINK